MDIQVYYMDIQLYYIYVYPSNIHTFMPSIGSSCVMINLSISIPPSWKVTFPVTSKPTPPTVFNLQALNWVHCGKKQVHITNYLGIPINWYKFLKSIIFAQKNVRTSKNSIKFIIHFFQKEIIGHTYIFT